MAQSEVVVIGAGPTGLMVAGELALRGVQVTILERLPEPDATIKAGSINVASAEMLDRRGLLPSAEAVQRRLIAAASGFIGRQGDDTIKARLDRQHGGARHFPVAGHFAGMLFREDLVDQDDPQLASHTAVAGGILVPQRDLEELLTEHCLRLGVDIRRGVEARALLDGDGIRLGEGEHVVLETSIGYLDAKWVVAADGGRSAIRKQLGIAFDGTDPQMVGYQAIADIDEPTVLKRGWTWTPRGIYVYGPMPGRILVARFAPQPADRSQSVTLEELQGVVREVTGTDVTLSGVRGRATRWSDNARQARSYRRGRIFLAGDAAHVHSPFSGQGANLGLGDAVNLGWKLAATINGWAPDGLLDTYETERHPIAAAVLDWTRAQVALMRGDAETAQLRNVLGETLLTVPGAMNRVVAISAGITQHYMFADDQHAPVGSIAGDVPLASGGRLADHVHDGRFALVDRSSDGRLARAVGGHRDRVAYLFDPIADERTPSLLVRPDGIIAWATASEGGSSGKEAPGGLKAALVRWAGVR